MASRPGRRSGSTSHSPAAAANRWPPTTADKEVRDVMRRHRESGRQEPVIITAEFDVAAWIRDSFRLWADDIGEMGGATTTMMYNTDVSDPNRPGMARLEIVLAMPDSSRWRLYPQAVPIYEPPHRVAAIFGPAASRAEVLGRRMEIDATPAIDVLGLKAVQAWAPVEALLALIQVYSDAGAEMSSVAAGLDVTDGTSFQWWRHFRSYGGRDREELFGTPQSEAASLSGGRSEKDVTQCWLVLLGSYRSDASGAGTWQQPKARAHWLHDRLLWLLRFQGSWATCAFHKPHRAQHNQPGPIRHFSSEDAAVLLDGWPARPLTEVEVEVEVVAAPQAGGPRRHSTPVSPGPSGLSVPASHRISTPEEPRPSWRPRSDNHWIHPA